MYTSSDEEQSHHRQGNDCLQKRKRDDEDKDRSGGGGKAQSVQRSDNDSSDGSTGISSEGGDNDSDGSTGSSSEGGDNDCDGSTGSSSEGGDEDNEGDHPEETSDIGEKRPKRSRVRKEHYGSAATRPEEKEKDVIRVMGSPVDVSVPAKIPNLCCIELPVIVANDSAGEKVAIKLLGGANSVADSVNGKKELNLQFHEKLHAIKSTRVGADTKHPQYALRVRRSFVNGAWQLKSAELVGRVVSTYKWTEPSDFAYIPPPKRVSEARVEQMGEGEVIAEAEGGAVEAKEKEKVWLDTVPSVFFRSTAATRKKKVHKFLEAPLNAAEEVISNRDAICFPANIVPFGVSPQVSDAGAAFLQKALALDPSMFAREGNNYTTSRTTKSSKIRRLGVAADLHALLQGNPMWTRSKLEDRFHKRLRYAVNDVIPTVAYNISNGPWRKLCVRYGYSPSEDPMARIHQVIDCRISEDKLKKYDGISAVVGAGGGEQNRNIFGVDIKGQMALPITQLTCRSIQELVLSEPRLSVCGPKHGWFRPDFIRSLRQKVVDIIDVKFGGKVGQGDMFTDTRPPLTPEEFMQRAISTNVEVIPVSQNMAD